MILLFVTATAASYLLAGAICLKASSDPKASSDGESQGSSWISLASGVILLLITIDIVAWSWWDEMAVYGWLDFGLILASPELSILVHVLTGALVRLTQNTGQLLLPQTRSYTRSGSGSSAV